MLDFSRKTQKNPSVLLPNSERTAENPTPALTDHMKRLTSQDLEYSERVTDSRTQKSFHITTFGCQMNQHDSDALEGLLLHAGFQQAEGPESADIILFNTCCVRDHAESRLYSRLSQMRSLKKEKPELILGVGGCVAQKEKGNLAERFPHVDIIFGTNAVHEILSFIERADRGERPVLSVPEDGPAVRSDEHLRPTDRRLHAWVSIMRGCDNYCSYCIVPYVRGPQRSKQPEEVLDEVTRLVQHGVKEITLLGQNVNAYGQDLDGRVGFAGLLARIDAVEGLLRIRFTTSHPKDISADLMHAIHDLPSVCEHLHLPVQSGSTRILRLMNRRYTAEEYLQKVARLYETVPGISLTTDVIIGFPGETEEDFEATRSLLQQAQFDGAYIFKFSQRQGTSAGRLADHVSKDIIRRRHQTLLNFQKEISRERLGRLAQSIQLVLPEHADPKRPGHLIGRTRGHRTAAFPGSQDFVGTEIPIRVTRLEGWTLIGKQLNTEEESSSFVSRN